MDGVSGGGGVPPLVVKCMQYWVGAHVVAPQATRAGAEVEAEGAALAVGAAEAEADGVSDADALGALAAASSCVTTWSCRHAHNARTAAMRINALVALEAC